jgi:hypothetical protein
MSLSRLTTFTLALATGFAIVAVDLADARVGGGGSFGSRGTRTYSAPTQTDTAPKAAPIDRSMTQKGAPTTTAQNTPSGAGAAFGGWRGLLMGGLIAAGLASIFGIGALASVLGFVLQVALVAGAAYLVVTFIRSRNQPTPVYDTWGQCTGAGQNTKGSKLRLERQHGRIRLRRADRPDRPRHVREAAW